MRISKRARGIVWFLTWCGFFSLAFTPAYQIADSLLLGALVVSFLSFNAVKVWKLWKYRSDPVMREALISSQGGIFESKRWRRWALDDYDDKDPN